MYSYLQLHNYKLKTIFFTIICCREIIIDTKIIFIFLNVIFQQYCSFNTFLKILPDGFLGMLSKNVISLIFLYGATLSFTNLVISSIPALEFCLRTTKALGLSPE